MFALSTRCRTDPILPYYTTTLLHYHYTNFNQVPYRPRRYLRAAAAGASPGDFVFLLGFPGHTMRYAPASRLAYSDQVAPHPHPIHTRFTPDLHPFHPPFTPLPHSIHTPFTPHSYLPPQIPPPPPNSHPNAHLTGRSASNGERLPREARPDHEARDRPRRVAEAGECYNAIVLSLYDNTIIG